MKANLKTLTEPLITRTVIQGSRDKIANFDVIIEDNRGDTRDIFGSNLDCGGPSIEGQRNHLVEIGKIISSPVNKTDLRNESSLFELSPEIRLINAFCLHYPMFISFRNIDYDNRL